MLPYIKYDNKKKYYSDICNHFSKIDNEFKIFIKYYDKYWINTSFIKFDCLSQNEYYFRTNNYIENFHRLLNDTLDSYHPKISYLNNHLKDFTIDGNKRYIVSLIKPLEEKYKKYSVCNSILDFIRKYYLKYKSKIDVTVIIQNEDDDIIQFINKSANKLEDFII